MDRLFIAVGVLILLGLAGDWLRRRSIVLRWRLRFAAWREQRAFDRVVRRVEDSHAALASMQPGDPQAEQKVMEAVIARGTADVLQAARFSGVQMSEADARAEAQRMLGEVGLS